MNLLSLINLLFIPGSILFFLTKKKNNLLNAVEHETRAKFKKTSIGRRPSTAMMNKKKTFKKYVGQGK